MKKQILLFFALFLTGTMFAQDQKLYISLSPGIGLGTGRARNIYWDGYESQPVSLGKGLNINLHAGYFLSSILAIDLGVTYRMGLNSKIDVDGYIIPYDVTTFSAGTYKYKASMLQIIPGILISPVPEESKIRPYGRLGFIIGLMPSVKEKGDIKLDQNGINKEVTEFKYSGGTSFGGQAAIGCDYNISDLLSIFAELYFNAISYSPTKGKYTKFEYNGVDQLPNMSIRDKECVFVKDRTEYLTGSMPAGEPYQNVKDNYPMNNAGINIGLKIKL